MDRLERLLLDLYRAAQAMPGEAFPDFALDLLQGMLPFNSARMLQGVQQGTGGVVVQGAYQYNEPTDTILDWASIHRVDPFVPLVIAQLGQAVPFHSPSQLGGPELAVVRDYVRRYRHQNALAVARPSPDRGHHQANNCLSSIALFRADPDAHFNADQCTLLACLGPHLMEALAINRSLALAGLDMDTGHSGVAVLGADGLLAYCDTSLGELLRAEWPDWRGPRLPEPLWQALTRSAMQGYVGAAVRFSASRIGAHLFLRGERLSRLSRLSPREAAMARLYGEGKSYKEIAQQTKLSPATVRNYLARVYAKLEISGKAELAVLLARHPAGVS